MNGVRTTPDPTGGWLPDGRSAAGAHVERGVTWGAAGLLAAIVVVSLNLRPAIVAVGPLSGAIHADTGMASWATSLLTTVPLLCLGAFAATASPLARRVGFERAVCAAIGLIVVGIALRLAAPLPALFAGSVLAGSGIAVANVVVPALIKRDFPERIGPSMALYSVALQTGATLAAGVTVPLREHLNLDWRWSLAMWELPAVLAALVWLPLARRRPRPDTVPAHRRYGVWRSGIGWAAAFFIGIQSGVYFTITAWLPSLLIDDGLSAGEAGGMLSVVGLCGIVGGLPMPLLAARLRSQRILVVFTAATFLVGLAGLLVAGAQWAVVWAIALGIGQGCGLSLALTLFTLRTHTADGAAQLSGMAQTAGYLLAATAPLLVGALHDASGGWTVPLVVLSVTLVPLTAAGWQIARPRFFEDDPATAREQESPLNEQDSTRPSWAHPDTRPDGVYERDQHYLTTRITADGRDGFPVAAGRYRLAAARACPWANRAIIVRRLLGLESALSMGLCAPVHDERSWTFDLDPDGRDPVLGIHRLREAYFARDPGYPRGITVPAVIEIATGQVVTNDFAQLTLDLSTEWTAHQRPGAPDLYPERLRDQIDEINAVVFAEVNDGVYRAGRASSQDAYEAAYNRLFTRLDDLSDRLSRTRYLVGDSITEADVRLFTTLARFDAVYHNHFKTNRSKLTEMPVLWAYARDLFQTPGFGDTIDFVQIKQHYYLTQTDINPSGIVPRGPDTAGWLTPHHRDDLAGRPFGDGTAPEPPSLSERVAVGHDAGPSAGAAGAVEMSGSSPS